MFTLNGRRLAGQLTKDEIEQLAAQCYKEYKDPRGNKKLPLSRMEVREMFQDLFFEDLDMLKGVCDRIFDGAFVDLDRDGDSMVTLKELTDWMIKLAENEGSLKKSDLEMENDEDE